MTLPGDCGRLTWRSWHAPPEEPTAKHMKDKDKRPRFSSLRQFSWSGSKDKGEDERLIESTVLEWYEQKHRKPSPEEATFVNSIPIRDCPHCRSRLFARHGKGPNGIQRYKCLGCHRRFTPLTGTIFDSRKIPISEWIEFLLHLFEFHSLKTPATDNRNAETTGGYWLSKVFAVLKGIQKDVVLKGTVWADEKLFDAPNAAKERAKAKTGSSLSRGCQYYVAIATDGDLAIFIVMGRSKPSDKSCMRTYGRHIAEGSALIHDGEPSHSSFIDALALRSEVHASAETKGLRDSENPMDPINDIHDKMEKFMSAHPGYDRSRLQDWMNLFWFLWCTPGDKMDKVKAFLKLAISKRMRIKFRDVYGKKGGDS